MATATLHRLSENAQLLHENVDEAEGIIRGVLIVGLKSRNKGRTIGCTREEFGDACDEEYSYSPEALQNAMSLYEGSVVRIDHPQFSRGPRGERTSSESRSAFDTFGELRDVRFIENKGLVGDLHYIRSHELAPRVVEVAQRFPKKFALSHNARGNPELVNGKIVITEIASVESVDLIGEQGGTTNGLFESTDTETPKMTKRAVLVVLNEQAAKGSKQAKHLMEMSGMEPAMASEMDVPAEASDGDQMQMAVDAMVLAIVNGEGTSDEKVAKIKLVLGATDEVTEAADDSEEESEGEEKAMEESNKELARVRKELKQLQEARQKEQDEIACRKLLENANREVTDVRVNALLRTPEKDRKSLIETWQNRATARRPEFSPPLYESDDCSYKYDGGESLAKALKG